jgi:hypothetical protein
MSPAWLTINGGPIDAPVGVVGDGSVLGGAVVAIVVDDGDGGLVDGAVGGGAASAQAVRMARTSRSGRIWRGYEALPS